MQAPARPIRSRPRTDAWRRRFIRLVIAFALTLQVPFVAMLRGVLAARHVHFSLLVAGIVALVVNVPLFYRLTHWTDEARAHWARVWLFETPYFVHLVAIMFFGPTAWLSWLAIGALDASGLANVAANPPWLFAPLYLAALAVSAYGTFVRRFWTPVRSVEVAVDRLPPGLDGYTLVQLSDVHCGPYLPRRFYRWLARRASALGADAIVLTGDMITHGVGYLDDVTDFVRHLSAPAGVFAALGNHDYFGTTMHEVAEAMRAGGAVVLRNEGITVDAHRDGGWYLAAIDDNWSRRDDLSRALAQHESERPCVLLAHDPDSFPDIAARERVDLVLSGHTHGGQIGVPFLAHRWNLARVRFRHTVGTFRSWRTALHVHPGNGTSGPPVRVGVAPAIVRLVLRRRTSSA